MREARSLVDSGMVVAINGVDYLRLSLLSSSSSLEGIFGQ